MDILEALEVAIRAEIDAQRTYIRLAAEAPDAEVKSLFEHLSEYEAMHRQFLEAERKALIATSGEESGRPSHWLKLLKAEIDRDGIPGVTQGGDLTQAKLSLSAAEGIARVLKKANEELLEKQSRYERELSIAADIQRKLLPQEPPQSADLQIAAANIMARPVGGDLYDFATDRNRRLSLVVADSMGKGVPAALLMTTVRAIWRGYSTLGLDSPGRVLGMINRTIYPDLSVTGTFVTMFVSLYDPATSTMRYSGAGHNPPLFRPAAGSECEELDIGGMPVGISPELGFPDGEFTMEKGDIVVIYTDGIVESRNSDAELFGIRGLCDVVNRNCSLGASDIMDAILTEVDSYTGGSPQTDDITVVVLKKI